MKTSLTLLLISSILLSLQCQQEEITSRDYPRLKTLPVTDVNLQGATFHGEVFYKGKSEILSHGFVFAYDTDPILTNTDSIFIKGAPSTSDFSVRQPAYLRQGSNYQVRAFITTASHTIYGNSVSFISQGSNAAVITDFYPKLARLTDTLTIIGKYFYPRNPVVGFGYDSRATAFETSDTLFRVIVPEDLRVDNCQIWVSNSTSPVKLEILHPEVLSVSKTSVRVCDTVTFTVANVAPNAHPYFVLGQSIGETVAQSQNKVVVRVPGFPRNPYYPIQDVYVVLSVGGFTSIANFGINLVSTRTKKFEPIGSSFLDTITIHFDQRPPCELTLKIDNKAVPVLEASGDYIRGIIPGNLQDPWNVDVKVLRNGTSFYDTLYQRVLRIESVTPASGRPGDIITIKGRGFHPTIINNIVCFDCSGTGFGTHGEILSGNTRELQVRIPAASPNTIGISIFTQNIGTLNFPFQVLP